MNTDVRIERLMSAFEGAPPRETLSLYSALVSSLLGGSKGSFVETANTLKNVIDLVALQTVQLENIRNTKEENLLDEED